MGDRDRSPHRMNSGGARGPVENRVYVANIPFDVKWQQVKELFISEVGEVVYVKLYNDEMGKSRGVAVVEFSDSSLATKAIQKMNKHEINGREIVVKKDVDGRDEYGRYGMMSGAGGRNMIGAIGREMNKGGMMTGAGGRNMIGAMGREMTTRGEGVVGDTYGLTTQFLESLGIEGEIHNRIFVSNLDYRVNDDKLREIFRYAGKVIVCKISYDKEGKSKGFGKIVFDHPVEAVQAISMFNEQHLYNRNMKIRMDNVKAEWEKPIHMMRLPEGLGGVGLGLGHGGKPLSNVRLSMGELQGRGSGIENALAVGSMGGDKADPLQAALATIAKMAENMGGNEGMSRLSAFNSNSLLVK